MCSAINEQKLRLKQFTYIVDITKWITCWICETLTTTFYFGSVKLSFDAGKYWYQHLFWSNELSKFSAKYEKDKLTLNKFDNNSNGNKHNGIFVCVFSCFPFCIHLWDRIKVFKLPLFDLRKDAGSQQIIQYFLFVHTNWSCHTPNCH